VVELRNPERQADVSTGMVSCHLGRRTDPWPEDSPLQNGACNPRLRSHFGDVLDAFARREGRNQVLMTALDRRGAKMALRVGSPGNRPDVHDSPSGVPRR